MVAQIDTVEARWMRDGLALLLGASLLAGPALAQAPAGFYVAAGIGVNQPQDSNLTTSGDTRAALGPGRGHVGFEPQAMGVMALGYGLGNGIRVELEGSLRANAVDRASTTAAQAPVTRSQGQLWNYGLMANALVDIDLGARWIRPYLGVGLGHVWSELRDVRVDGNRRRLAVDGSEGSLAYQAILGAAFPIPGWTGLSATAEYRFLGLSDPDYAASLTRTGRRLGQDGRAAINPYHHSILFGLRYAFGAEPEVPPFQPLPTAPPRPWPAPPIPAAPVTENFLIHFGPNSADLTSQAQAVVGEAARAAGDRLARIELSATGDTGRTRQRLSRHRMAAVAGALRLQGIRREDIVSLGPGASRNRGPGEARNRGPSAARNRGVEIAIR